MKFAATQAIAESVSHQLDINHILPQVLDKESPIYCCRKSKINLLKTLNQT